MAKTGTVFLVGAGPGDSSLITVRALELLHDAQVLVYDRLASPLLLQEVPPSCRKIFVGKEPHRHSATQEDINRILVEQALSGADVVRLKGGDPFVFGRGGEEIQALESAGIPYLVVPGVSSAIAAAELAGIPVTHRGAARAFTVIAGHSAGAVQDSFRRYARYEGTLVFLMGMAALPRIASDLQAGGMSGDTPVSVVQSGATLSQRRITATLRTVVREAERAAIASPAVIVVGACAGFSFCSERLPLFRRKIAVAGTHDFARALVSALRSRCAAVIAEAPVLRVRHCDMDLPDMSRIEWLFFTSSSAVRAFFSNLQKSRTDVRSLSRLRFAAVGSGTSAALSQYGIYADFVPSRPDSAALASEFAERYSPCGMVLLLRTQAAAPELPRLLSERGIAFSDIPVYSLSADEDALQYVRLHLRVLDYIVVSSTAAADALVSAFAGELRGFAGKWLCLGRKSYAAMRRALPEAGNIVLCDGFDSAAVLRALS